MNSHVKLACTALLFLFAATVCAAQELVIGVTYVCNGEHIYIESCNIRDTSDSSLCMVAHPDHLTPTGINSYTNVSRGDLKKLLPTCQQPKPEQVAAAKAFQKKQQDIYNANVQKADEQMKAYTQQANSNGQPAKPKSPEDRALARCITSGRLPASCTGNSLLSAFGDMVSRVLPSAKSESGPGPVMAGVFQGAGNWKLDFIDDGVLVNCSVLSPDQHRYTVDFKNNHATITVDTRPKPLVLTFRDGNIVGPGPLTLDGVIASGYQEGGSSYGQIYKDSSGNLYDHAGNPIHGPVNNLPGHATFSGKTVTCPALNLSSKGADVGVQTMQTDLLKTMFSGEKGPPTPPGIRMQGIFAASSGFSVQFFPESAVLGCGPDAARAYPYTVAADGRAVITIPAPDHPLTLAIKPDGSLDPGAATPYQVHGRVVTGQNNDGDFTFAPMEQTCTLALLTPGKTIPSTGGTAAAATTASGAPSNGGGTLSTPANPLGNAALTIASGFPAPNPLAGRPYILLRSTYAQILARVGVAVPPGTSPYKQVGMLCAQRSPDCAKVNDAVKADAASAVRADGNGAGTFPGVPPGTYYLMITAIYNGHPLLWAQPVQLKAGANSMTLNQSNATPLN